MQRSLGIAVPAYDPDPERLASYVEALDELDPDAVRIELDAPTPSIRDALEALPVTVNAVPRRRGKGAAVTAAFEALETDVYAFADADGSTPVSSLRRVVDRVREGDAALAVGSRRHPDAEVLASQSRVRERLGDAYAGLARRLLPVALYDYQCGAKAVDADAWASIRGELYERGFGWDVDLVAAAGRRGLAIEEVPIRWEDRPGSTVDPLGAAPSLFRALYRGRRRRGGADRRERPLCERVTDHD